jgi:hypothetical protein
MASGWSLLNLVEYNKMAQFGNAPVVSDYVVEVTEAACRDSPMRGGSCSMIV